MSNASMYEQPRWLRDLLRFLPLKSQFVLSRNVRDFQLAEVGPNAVSAQPLTGVLAAELKRVGYAHILLYDLITGFQLLPSPGQPANGQALFGKLGLQGGEDGRASAGLELFGEVLQRLVNQPAADPPIALIADFASRLTVRNEALSPTEHQAFTRALILSHQARPRPYGTPPRPFINSMIWIVDKEGDLPDWLLVDNPRIRHIPVAKPDHRIRRSLAPPLLKTLKGGGDATPEDFAEAIHDFVEQTEGLLLVDMTAIAQLGRSESLDISQIGDAVRRYKVGVTEDPWAKIDREKIKGGFDFIQARVKGQDHAVTHILDIVKRAVTGVGAPRRGNRPRGVAFLAGPTGVGKTELAKTLTSLLFGDDSAYIRFDMSEFSAEHSDQRLIGAPPGYVGYDVGGELTNAIRERPFAVVLFDEIEKAHPRILDKFLQVLDDGVLTSGRGDRVYFSEAFIIFTSNLGIYRTGPDGERIPNVTADDGIADVTSRIKSEIDRHFKLVLNRPEILNRIGDNVLVFDFVRPNIAQDIFAGMVADTLEGVQKSQGIAISLSKAARAGLNQLCLEDLSNGGRGIRNKVEAHLINPLARALFDGNCTRNDRATIAAIEKGDDGITVLKLEIATAEVTT
jgi:hypothetical protein